MQDNMKKLNTYFLLLILLISSHTFANSKQMSCKSRTYNILVFGMGMHSGLVLKTKELPFLEKDIIEHPYVEIGFGDLGFFRAGDFWNKPFREKSHP